ncbi:hypothetical protein [Streptomyces sp. RFCAC02]|uniref:hypothetical protein n=1 Tax=Streptomyces sp. RFCAC02 TaxID=2499143 RepID=UPI00143D20A8|nr:hypothetical protein [Streptomyces sp. RFCAC02]
MLVAAGPWADDSGAVLVLDTDRPGPERIVAADPYFRTPGVRVSGVRECTPGVGPGGA